MKMDFKRSMRISPLMLILYCLCEFLIVLPAANCFYRMKKSPIPPTGENGEPLFLTPFLEKGEIEQAKKLARVEPLAGSVDSYAGFFTVNKTYDSNHFFWFFPADKSPQNAPVLVWLQGGPGASSLFGLFAEHGPYAVKRDGKTVYQRKYSWTKTFSMLYLDNPVGTGFSFTKQDDGYCKCEEDVAENLYRTIAQFFQLFPELRKNDFYVTGESYGGKYAPGLAYAIHENNKISKTKINLKGVAIGNGYSDPVNMLSYGNYLYELGLIDDEHRNVFNKVRELTRKLIQNGEMEKAFEYWDVLLNNDLHNSTSFFTNITGFNNYYNYLYSTEYDLDQAAVIVQQNFVRQKIHVGNLPFNEGKNCEMHLKRDMMRSVAPWIKVLLENDYKFMVYNGQLDIIVAYPLTVEFLQNLEWSGSEEYKYAKRYIWKVDDSDKEVAGYVRFARNLVEVMVRNAGHMVPADQPRAAYDLINKFVFDVQKLIH